MSSSKNPPKTYCGKYDKPHLTKGNASECFQKGFRVGFRKGREDALSEIQARQQHDNSSNFYRLQDNSAVFYRDRIANIEQAIAEMLESDKKKKKKKSPKKSPSKRKK